MEKHPLKINQTIENLSLTRLFLVPRWNRWHIYGRSLVCTHLLHCNPSLQQTSQIPPNTHSETVENSRIVKMANRNQSNGCIQAAKKRAKECLQTYLSRAIIYTACRARCAVAQDCLARVDGHADTAVATVAFCACADMLVRSCMRTHCVCMAHASQAGVNCCIKDATKTE